MKAVFTLILLNLIMFLVIARAELVSVEFEAEAATVVAQPFGLDVPRLTMVRGFFTYDSETADIKGADLRRGDFRLNTDWKFHAEFLDHVVTGSTQAKATTETFGYTLAIGDGGNQDETNDMTFDGTSAEDIELVLRIVGDEGDLPTDQLPETFGFVGAPHTFTLGDESGTILLQFLSYRQVFPVIKSINWQNNQVRLVWDSILDRVYRVEFSSDLKNWQTIRAAVTGELGTTGIIDDIFGRQEPPVPHGFYRIREIPPEPAGP